MEQIVLLAIFLLVGLVNAIVRWRQQSREAPPEPAPPPPRREPPPRPAELPPRIRVTVPLPAASVPAARRPPVPVPAPRTPPRRRPVHRWLGRRADVRRAIVVMTVLGPCRALEVEPGIRTPGPAGA